MSIGADCLVGMVIAQHENDVGLPLFGLSEEERHQDRHIRDDTAMIFAEGIGVEFHSIRFIDGLVKPNTGSVPLVSSSRGRVTKQVEALVCENCFMVYNPAVPGSCLCG